MKVIASIMTFLTVASFLEVEVIRSPAWSGQGDPELVVYDAQNGVFYDHNRIPYDNFVAAGAGQISSCDLERVKSVYDGPREVPFERSIELSLSVHDFYLGRESREFTLCAVIGATALPSKRRLVLINAEQAINEIKGDDTTRYRVWPHLGLLFVGTAASEEGCEVVLWDELVQGYAPLDRLIEPGDIVGLSLVTSGIERGMVLASEAKKRGARCVIAGNDSAIFRADQILSLPGKPVDAVFDSNSLQAVRGFCCQIKDRSVEDVEVVGVRTRPTGQSRSNELSQLKKEKAELARSRRDSPVCFEKDAFLIPDFSLFPSEYWRQVWGNYNVTFGHKFERDKEELRPATALLAQGCTRTRGSEACVYCSIAHVGDVRVPSRQYILDTIDAYHAFGVNNLYNVTDSVYEMAPVVARVAKEAESPFRGLFLYGRAQGLTQHPEFLDEWLELVSERLVVNMGLDSGDDIMLSQGVGKSPSKSKSGQLLEENSRAVKLLKSSGAHLHGSFLFGSPGESQDSCERTLEFAAWAAEELGQQCDTLESDIFWLNFGSPAGQLFVDYDYAAGLAAQAGKELSVEDWKRDFWSRRNDLVVGPDTEQMWYRYFTQIDLDQAQQYVASVDDIMSKVPGSVAARGFNPKGRK